MHAGSICIMNILQEGGGRSYLSPFPICFESPEPTNTRGPQAWAEFLPCRRAVPQSARVSLFTAPRDGIETEVTNQWLSTLGFAPLSFHSGPCRIQTPTAESCKTHAHAGTPRRSVTHSLTWTALLVKWMGTSHRQAQGTEIVLDININD